MESSKFSEIKKGENDMESCHILPRKPIHIGMFLSKENGKIFIQTYKHEIVYFESCYEHASNLPVILDDKGHEEKYYLFQYIDDDTSEVDYIGNLNEFSLLEVDYYNQALEYFYGEDPIKLGIVKSKYYDGNVFSYHVDSDYVIKAHTRGGFLDLNGDFTKEENILLNYIFREKITKLSLENYFEKKEEIQKYVYSLDIDSLISSYTIKRMERYDRKLDLYHTWFAGLLDSNDAYLRSLLPNYFYGRDWDSLECEEDMNANVFEHTRKILSILKARENNIKQEALTNYSKEKHIDTLLFLYIKSLEKRKEDHYKKFVLPKLIMWNRLEPRKK